MISASLMDDRTGLTLSEASQLVRSKKVSPVELTRECLSRIERLNPKLNAFITVTADSAVAEARQAKAEVQHNRWRGPLHGIPIALKDLVDTAGVHTTAASGVFKDRIPTEDAEIVRRLKAAGAVFLGKLNLQECAYGGSSGGKPYSGGAHDIKFINNVFERGANGKCGAYGPITDFDPSKPGNVWSGNVWDNGQPVPSA